MDWFETKLDGDRITDSNSVLFDRTPIEDIPAKAIKDAVYKVLDIKRPEEHQLLFF